MNIGSISISTNAADWLKVKAALEHASVRSLVGKMLAREISKSTSKWIGDLEVAAAERQMDTADLWELILSGGDLPPVTDRSAAIAKLIEHRDAGRLYSEETKK